jgi:CIC family chloride channel protein
VRAGAGDRGHDRLGAVAFRALIGFVHNAFYNGRLSIFYDANIAEGPSRFGGWVFFSPIIGGLIVVYIVKHFAPEANTAFPK